MFDVPVCLRYVMWMLNFLLLLINKIVFNSNHIQTDKFGTVEVTHTKIEKVYNL
jgi:hypothetical protein